MVKLTEHVVSNGTFQVLHFKNRYMINLLEDVGGLYKSIKAFGQRVYGSISHPYWRPAFLCITDRLVRT